MSRSKLLYVNLFDFVSVKRCPKTPLVLGSVVLVGGFGNLAGEMDFYGMTDHGNCERMATCHASCTVSVEWAADGIHTITAVSSFTSFYDLRRVVQRLPVRYRGRRAASTGLFSLSLSLWERLLGIWPVAHSVSVWR